MRKKILIALVAVAAYAAVCVVAAIVFKAMRPAKPSVPSIAPVSANASDLFFEEIRARSRSEKAVASLFDSRVRHTARFPALTQRAGHEEENGQRFWVVSGEVFCKNAFNAELRHEYAIRLRVVRPGKDPQFEFVEAVVDGKVIRAVDGG